MEVTSLMLTYRCNKSCVYCPIEKKDEDMNFDVAKKIIDFLNNNSSEKKIIKFFGGEPLLRYDLIKKCIEYAGHDFFYQIVTNGKLLTKKMLNFFLDYEIDLAVSFDFESKNDFETINMFGNDKFFLTVNLLIRPLDVHGLYDNFKKFINYGVERFNFLPANYTVLWREKDLQIFKNQFFKISKLYWRKKSKGHNIFFKGFEEYEEERIKNSPLASHNLFFDTDGCAYASDAVLLLEKKQRSKYKILKPPYHNFVFSNNCIHDLSLDLKRHWGEKVIQSNEMLKQYLDDANKLIKI
ncbi:radical SAM protein [Candidatus Parcubacteria bacterium]|nr:radical SAM protein [Candidatus Parcubacteria bacterium]